jgi:tRNA threonylcarbamoyladenosine biosynthesis protein TsaB
MNVILFIDTANNTEIKVGLIIDGKEHLLEQTVDRRRSQAVLPLIEQLLDQHKLKLSDISEIRVNPGPGSFTGLRVGITIANTLGFLLQVPVNGKKVGELVDAEYTS